jgi:hypothetical protein
VKCGYYFLGGRYDPKDEHFHEANSYTTLFRTGLWDATAPDSPEGDVATLVAHLRRAKEHGKTLVLALDINFPQTPNWTEVLERIPQDVLESIEYVELADEPFWTEAEAELISTSARNKLEKRGVQPKLGVTLSRQQILAGDAFRYAASKGYGYIGIEVYNPPSRDEQDIYDFAEELFTRVPWSVDRWVVGQSYNMGGTWKHRHVVDIQWPIAKAASALQAQALLWFAYGRPGGVVSNRRLAARHKEIYQEMCQ